MNQTAFIGIINHDLSVLSNSLRAITIDNLTVWVKENKEERLENINDILYMMNQHIESLNKHLENYLTVSQKLLNELGETAKESLFDNPKAYEEHHGIVERDENDNLHVGKVVVGYKFCAPFINQEVVLRNVVYNENPQSKDKYPYFAKFVSKL